MMKPVLAAALLAGVAVFTPPAARAQNTERYTPISGEALIRLCTGRNQAQTRECDAYIDGVSDTITSYQASRPQSGNKGQPLPDYACVPGKLTGPQLRTAVVDWAKQNRDGLRQQASVVVIRALMDTYPCRQ